MKKRISVLVAAATILISTMVVEPAFAYRLTVPACHYRVDYGDYVLRRDSRHLNHPADGYALWDDDNRRYYCPDIASAFFAGPTSSASASASATATATTVGALSETGGPYYLPALASAAALGLLGSGLLALRMVLGRPGGS
jgi:hypothetical protein